MTNVSYQTLEIAEVVAAIGRASGWGIKSPHDLLLILEGATHIRWLQIDDWEEMPDSSIFDEITRLNSLSGKVCVISEASYRNNRGAFSVDAGQLREFVASHLKVFGESIFNGDTIFFAPDRGAIVVFHHEGVWAAFDLHAN